MLEGVKLVLNLLQLAANLQQVAANLPQLAANLPQLVLNLPQLVSNPATPSFLPGPPLNQRGPPSADRCPRFLDDFLAEVLLNRYPAPKWPSLVLLSWHRSPESLPCQPEAKVRPRRYRELVYWHKAGQGR